MRDTKDELESAVKRLEYTTNLLTGTRNVKPLTSIELSLRPGISIGSIPGLGSLPGPLPTIGPPPINKVPYMLPSRGPQSQKGSPLPPNSILQKDATKFKKALLDAQKGLSEARKNLLVVQRDLSNTRKRLSDTEKALSNAKAENEELAQALEKKPTSKPKPGKNPIIGGFNTRAVRSDTEVVEKTSKQVTFPGPYSAPPSVAIGLNSMDIGNDANMRISCFISNLTGDGFDVNIDGDPNTNLYSGSCAWLEIEPNHPDFQVGKFNTLEDYPWTTPQASHKCKVAFQRPYSEPPQVVVWLTSFDMNPEKNWRLKTYTSDITATGFTIHISSWDDTGFFDAGACWVAYPTGKAGVCSGSVNTLDVRPYNAPGTENSGSIQFPEGAFTTTPRVFMAINAVDISCKQDMRLEVKASSISASGMTWHANSWKDTTLYSAGASYIALR